MRSESLPAEKQLTQSQILALYRFYGVSTLEGLAAAQDHHIERLQSRLPPIRDEFPRTPREG